jgi:hypothetical protein
MTIFRKIIPILIILFLVSIGTLYFSFKQKLEKIPELEISVTGPKEIKTFEIKNYRINILNKSKIILKNIKLNVFLPENATFLFPNNTKKLDFSFDLEPETLKSYDVSLVFSSGEGVFPLKIVAKNNQIESEYIYDINLIGEGIETNIEIPKTVEKEVEFPIKITIRNNLNEDKEIYFKINPILGLKFLDNEEEINEYKEKFIIKKNEKIEKEVFGIFKSEANYGIKNFNFEIYLTEDKEILYGKNINLALMLEKSKVLVDLNLPKFIEPNDELDLKLEIKNNSDKILKTSKVKIETAPEYFEISKIKVLNGGFAKLEETLNLYWDYEKSPELYKISPNQSVLLFFNLKTKIPQNYFNLQIPFKVIFKDELENIQYEKILNLKVKGELDIERKISLVSGPNSLKAQKTSTFLVKFKLIPKGEEISNFTLYFKTPYWSKIKNASEGEFSENSFYIKKDKIDKEENIEILIEVTPYINQVGENILILEKNNISFRQEFSQIDVNFNLPEIDSSYKSIENFIPGAVSL